MEVSDLFGDLSRPAEQGAGPTGPKIVLLVLDGLGGLPDPSSGLTELEAAHTPNLDRLAEQGACGLLDPVAPGITPGSGPGHLALFGYDPLAFRIGRGVLEGVGIGLQLNDGDVVARGNFCTVDEEGVLTDRRAGRVPTEVSSELCRLLNSIEVDGAHVRVEPVRDHRFVLVLSGEGLSPLLSETDPQRVGVAPLPVQPLAEEARATARIASDFVRQARALLADKRPANMVMLRGFSSLPNFPSMEQRYGLRAAAVATYPMYRGLARLLGMEVLPTGTTFEEQVKSVASGWERFDFFFVHYKATDAAGEDGDFVRKQVAIEHVDRTLPALLALEPEVLVVTGDHSTPARLAAHSWHPVPLLLHAASCRRDRVTAFGEGQCLQGGLGRILGKELMGLVLAHAQRLDKFGA